MWPSSLQSASNVSSDSWQAFTVTPKALIASVMILSNTITANRLVYEELEPPET